MGRISGGCRTASAAGGTEQRVRPGAYPFRATSKHPLSCKPAFQQWLAVSCSSICLMTVFISMPARGFQDCSVAVFWASARDLVSCMQLAFRCSSLCCFCALSAGVPNSMVASIARSHGLSVMTVLPLILHVLTVCAPAVGMARQTKSGRIVRISSPRLLVRRNNSTQGLSVV